MADLLQYKKLIFPDLMDKMQKRYQIIQLISMYEPIGRRLMIERLHLPERFVRNELELLQQFGLITATRKGMMMTLEGTAIIHGLKGYMKELTGLRTL